MKITKEYKRSEGIIIIYHLLILIDETFSFPKNVEEKINELYEELVNIMDNDLLDYDIVEREIIERLTYEKEES